MFERPKESCPATSKRTHAPGGRCCCMVPNPVTVLAVREKMAQAYDFALDKIGMEIMSYQVRESEP